MSLNGMHWILIAGWKDGPEIIKLCCFIFKGFENDRIYCYHSNGTEMVDYSDICGEMVLK